MKVILIGNYELAGQQSMLRFANLLAYLLDKYGHGVQILRPRALFGKLLPPSTTAGKWLGYIDQFVIFPMTLFTRVRDADIVHICDHSNAMYLPYVKHRPTLITCHDILAIRSARGDFSHNRITWSGRILQSWVVRNLRIAQAIAFVSEKTCRDFISVQKGSAEVAKVIYNCLSYPFNSLSFSQSKPYLDATGLTETPFFLSVGGNQWYKNRIGALRLFHALSQYVEYGRHHFVMVGQPLTNELRNYIAMNRLQGRVHELVDITNEELSALYHRAEALLFPSHEEGFGWPPIEAQACGCPAVISDIAPLNEITTRDAAIFIDPNDIAASAETVRIGLQKRELLVQAGLVNAQRYSEETFVREYLAMYKKTIALFEVSSFK